MGTMMEKDRVLIFMCVMPQGGSKDGRIKALGESSVSYHMGNNP
jgi:hypothetical protein